MRLEERARRRGASGYGRGEGGKVGRWEKAEGGKEGKRGGGRGERGQRRDQKERKEAHLGMSSTLGAGGAASVSCGRSFGFLRIWVRVGRTLYSLRRGRAGGGARVRVGPREGEGGGGAREGGKQGDAPLSLALVRVVAELVALLAAALRRREGRGQPPRLVPVHERARDGPSGCGRRGLLAVAVSAWRPAWRACAAAGRGEAEVVGGVHGGRAGRGCWSG